jgi:cytochrome P450
MLQMNELSHNEVVDNMMSFLLAGHETSASFLSFAIYLLGSNPEVQNAIRSELRTAKSSTGMPASDTLDCIIKEALRLYPPAPMIGRVAESV